MLQSADYSKTISTIYYMYIFVHSDSERNRIIILHVAKDIKREEMTMQCATIKPTLRAVRCHQNSMYLHKINVNSYHILQLYIVSIFVVYGL